LEGRATNNKVAKAKVLLFFLVKKSYRATWNLISNFEKFEAMQTLVYTKPKKYNELDYKIKTLEL
jgi:hypothetical protein